MQLNCALLQGHDIRVVDRVAIGPDTTVADLAEAIRIVPARTAATRTPSDSTLTIYLTQTISHTHNGAWPQRSKLPLLNESLIMEHGVRLHDPSQLLQSSQLFGSDFRCNTHDVHIVAVVHENGKEPPHKRARTSTIDKCWDSIVDPCVLFGPCFVPLSTIDAFRAIQGALCLRQQKSMVLLSGPRFSGKTIIARGIRRWIQSAIGQKRCCLVAELKPSKLANDASLWNALGKLIDPDGDCTDQASFVRVAASLPPLWFLIVDNLQRLLAMPTLKLQFLDALRELRELPNFGGFLGVGLCDDTMQALIEAEAERSDGLFPKDAVIKTQLFSNEQIRGLYEQVKADRTFADTLQCGLTAYSGRSPGVLASILAFTIEEDQCDLQFPAWTEWFETTAFAVYVMRNVNVFQHLM